MEGRKKKGVRKKGGWRKKGKEEVLKEVDMYFKDDCPCYMHTHISCFFILFFIQNSSVQIKDMLSNCGLKFLFPKEDEIMKNELKFPNIH